MLGTIGNVGISHVAAVVPKQRIPVEERCSALMTAKKAVRMARGTGITELSIAPQTMFASDMCVAAAENLFENGASRGQIGAVVFVSQTPDSMVPATSFYIQERLQLGTDILAFDVTQGCAGFAYGLYIASSLLSNLDKSVLLLCGDTGSREASPEDTSLFSIVGDAGSAAIISRCRGSGAKKIFFNIESYGERAQVLYGERSGHRAFHLTNPEGKRTIERSNYTVMDGMGIMDFSLHEVPANIEALLHYANVEKGEIEMAIVHQAQKLIVESLADKLGLPREKVPFKSGHVGNTDMATIPVCLTELKKDGEYRPWKTALLSGFGVGLSVASMIVDLSDTVVLETGEI